MKYMVPFFAISIVACGVVLERAFGVYYRHEEDSFAGLWRKWSSGPFRDLMA